MSDSPTLQNHAVQVPGASRIWRALRHRNFKLFFAGQSISLIGTWMSLAGAVIALAGEGYCFLIDGLSYLAVIASLLMMRLKPLEIAHSAAPMFQQLKEGWEYVAHSVPIRTILLLFGLISLMGWPFTVLMPVFAANILHGGAHTLEFLWARWEWGR